MLFNSYEFLFFLLPAALLGYYVVLPKSWRMAWLTLVGYVFYGWWDPRFVLLLAASTCFDFWAGKNLAAAASQRARKRWLVFSITMNLTFLGIFKYYDLGAATLNWLAAELGAASPFVRLLHVTLPIGISFYTFASMSYCIDLYYGVVKPARTLWSYAGYVAMFPQLVAGPIVRYHEIEHQLVHRTHTWAKASAGLTFFILGFAKKVIIADAVAPLVGEAFGKSGVGFVAAWSGLVAYAMQIYYDFSAYSDMAVGLALLLGFTLPQNFNSPYKSRSITEFWRRWHLSLSKWLRDYLYIPLGGSRRSAARTYVNLFITMLLGGLWHGASWTFVLWGGYHGLLLALERACGKRGLLPAPAAVQTAATFLLVLFGWLLFRCETLQHVGWMLRGLCGANGLGAGFLGYFAGNPVSAVMLVFALALTWSSPNTWEIRWRPSWLLSAGLAVLFAVCVAIMLLNQSSPFLYFQF